MDEIALWYHINGCNGQYGHWEKMAIISVMAIAGVMQIYGIFTVMANIAEMTATYRSVSNDYNSCNRHTGCKSLMDVMDMIVLMTPTIIMDSINKDSSSYSDSNLYYNGVCVRACVRV